MTRWVKLRVLVATAILAVAVGGVWLVPGSTAGAATSKADCDVIENIGDKAGTLSALGASDAAATSTALKAASKKVEDKKLKSALKSMSGIYKSVGKASNKVAAGLAVAKNARKYGLAAATFSQALLSCVTTQLTLPPNVTLPSGLTLPTLPKR